VRETGRGISAARNAGVEVARGEWIAFTDDDQIAEPIWLVSLWQAQLRTGASCVGGARTLELADDLLRELPLQTRLILGEIPAVGDLHVCTRDALLCTGNLLVRRGLVLELGGFDVALTQGGEDTDLIMRLRRAGHVIWFTPNAIVRHIIPPYRLDARYLSWAARRGGDCYAMRDVREWGILRTFPIAAARLGQAVTMHVPAMAYARLRGNGPLATAHKCRLLRAVAYARRVVECAFSNARVKNDSGPGATEFRGERSMFDRPTG
jgi:glycosyltransferase involved in cell wall biosynthesis